MLGEAKAPHAALGAYSKFTAAGARPARTALVVRCWWGREGAKDLFFSFFLQFVKSCPPRAECLRAPVQNLKTFK